MHKCCSALPNVVKGILNIPFGFPAPELASIYLHRPPTPPTDGSKLHITTLERPYQDGTGSSAHRHKFWRYFAALTILTTLFSSFDGPLSAQLPHRARKIWFLLKPSHPTSFRVGPGKCMGVRNKDSESIFLREIPCEILKICQLRKL